MADRRGRGGFKSTRAKRVDNVRELGGFVKSAMSIKQYYKNNMVEMCNFKKWKLNGCCFNKENYII